MKTITSRRLSTAPSQLRFRTPRAHKTLCLGLATLIVVWGAACIILFRHYESAATARAAASKKAINQIEAKAADLRSRKLLEGQTAADEKAKAAAEAEKVTGEAKESPGAASQLPPAAAATTCGAPGPHTNPAAIDVVVNKKRCLQPLTFAPPDLVTSNGATLSSKAMDSFNRMFAAAAAAGQPFLVSSSFRSYSTQVSTYNYWVGVSGQAGADTYSARPGYSEHQTGLVVDVGAGDCVLDCFGSTSQYQWLQDNAAKYGFIQRYYKGYEGVTGYVAEEWHYRYVGTAVAEDMRAKGIKTLEQYFGVEGGDYR